MVQLENLLWVALGSAGSIAAFWIIVRYVLSRLDHKVDKDVFDQYCLRVSDNLDAGKRRFDKVDKGLEDNLKAINHFSTILQGSCVMIENLKDTIKELKNGHTDKDDLG